MFDQEREHNVNYPKERRFMKVKATEKKKVISKVNLRKTNA